MKTQLMIHCGGTPAALGDLQSVPLPEETETYKTISHYDLVTNIERVACDMLRDYTFDKGMYALAKDGARMFGVHTYSTESSDLSLAIGFRNSYDKTLSVGIAVGAAVQICDNLMFAGQITVLRKHTRNVIDDLELAILKVVYKSQHHFIRMTEAAERMRGLSMTDDDAYKLLGLLFGRQILMPRQLTVAKQEWSKPGYPAFLPRTGWSFYNAITTALKSTPPNRILERHIALHDLMKEWDDN
jgi:hypothetical protein